MMQVFEIKEQMQPVEKNPENQDVLHVQVHNFLSMIEESHHYVLSQAFSANVRLYFKEPDTQKSSGS